MNQSGFRGKAVRVDKYKIRACVHIHAQKQMGTKLIWSSICSLSIEGIYAKDIR